jgi:hypothetical protein
MMSHKSIVLHYTNYNAIGGNCQDVLKKRLLRAYKKLKKGRGFVQTQCAARSDRVCDTVALRASQGRFAPMLRMTAGWEVSRCFLTYDYHKTIFLLVILSVRSPRSFLQSSKAAMRREQQKVEERSDEEIYERLLPTIPCEKEIFRVKNAKEGHRMVRT